MPSHHRHELRVLDAHYGGDVSRVVIGGVPKVPGQSVAAKRDWLRTEGDALRKLLLGAPYGDPSMCANVIVDVDPTLPEAEAGYVIMEAMGYPHFSGSNSMCVVAALLESGYLPLGEPGTRVVYLEAPSGLVRAEARHNGTDVESITLACDPAWVAARDVVLDVAGLGELRIDVVWSGCFYAVVDAADLDFALSPHEVPALAEAGAAICPVGDAALDLFHPVHGDCGPLSFVAFAGPVQADGTARSATYVHPGVVCRCPTGTGTAARLALARERGEAEVGDELVTVSPTGSRMHGRIVGDADRGRTGASDGVDVAVTGRPFTLGRLDLVVNLDDDLTAFDEPGAVDTVWRLLTGTVDPSD